MKFKKALFAFALLSMLVLPVGCGESSSTSGILPTTSEEEPYIDYAANTRIHTENWKNTDFFETGTGKATLFRNVDGDTAHFYAGATSRYVQARFNGVDTPESTGVLEPWGKKAARFTADILNNAKTIILETERTDGVIGPEADSTGNRYLVWIWTSTRSIEEEDGSQLKLLNLQLVQEGFSPAKGASESVYRDTMLDADAQAQRLKLHIWSNEKDDEFYDGEATVTNLKDVFSKPDEWIGKKVYVEGVVSRTMGTNAYIQESFENEDGTVESYGCYIFTMYKEYAALTKGNRIGVTGTVAEHYGSYQLVDVKYNPYTPTEDDMKVLEEGLTVEPRELTVAEAKKGEGMGTLVKIKGLVATGGYGGLDETDRNGNQNTTNSMTIYTKNSNGETFNIRIDGSTFIRDLNKKQIKTYQYFVNWCKENPNGSFDITGIMGKYESQTSGNVEIQLMLVATSDLVYNS